MASSALLSPSSPSNSLDNALLIIVRFSASIPDLPLDVPTPETTTGAGLKQLIRTKLPPTLSSHRLRLIYAGRGLEDTTALTNSLKLPPSPSRSPIPPPLPDDTQDGADDQEPGSSKDKGKKAVRDTRPRIYIHCSIGDIALSDSDLSTEASQASTLKSDHTDPEPKPSSRAAASLAQSTTTPAPRGFDRLLSAGFTAAEVTALRSQFLAVQSVSRTPDTMPSGEALRDLEDRWMDEGSTAAGSAGVEGAGVEEEDGLGTGSRTAMDDMLWGAVMGFFWPIGCAMWLRREEGVWSWRKGFAVAVGVIVNMAFGAMKIMN